MKDIGGADERLDKPDDFSFDKFYRFLKSYMPKKHYEFIQYTLEKAQVNAEQNIQFTDTIMELINKQTLPDWFVNDIQNIVGRKKN